jgi:hypothetical protein
MDPDLDPTPDTTPFLIDLKDAKKNFLFLFFSYNLPTGTLSSVLKIKFFANIFCVRIISVRSTPLWENGRIRKHADSDPDPDLQHCFLGEEKMPLLDRTLGSAFIKTDSGPY